jgi:hypothetical protein
MIWCKHPENLRWKSRSQFLRFEHHFVRPIDSIYTEFNKDQCYCASSCVQPDVTQSEICRKLGNVPIRSGKFSQCKFCIRNTECLNQSSNRFRLHQELWPPKHVALAKTVPKTWLGVYLNAILEHMIFRHSKYADTLWNRHCSLSRGNLMQVARKLRFLWSACRERHCSMAGRKTSWNFEIAKALFPKIGFQRVSALNL